MGHAMARPKVGAIFSAERPNLAISRGRILFANSRLSGFSIFEEAELNAVNNGVSIVPDGQNGRRSVGTAVADFLDETTLTKKPKTLAAYTPALSYFTESCHKLNLEEIERNELLKFSAFLRDEKDQAPSSVYNKFENVMTFLKAQGIRGLARLSLGLPRYSSQK
jgi:hypothetical protein